MKKGMALFLAVILCLVAFCPGVRAEGDTLTIHARSAVLMDAASGEIFYSYREDVRMPIASVTKIMSLILIFEAVEDGRLQWDEMWTVSPTAAGMGGSQVYLEAGDRHSVSELTKSVIVASANDACVALAEAVAGSEEVFVQRMNEKAESLGAVNTHFANCTGLPATDAGSCAADVALFSRELMRHEKYFEFSSVWMDQVEHSGGRVTQISNTNKLLRSYAGADGVKTGFTNEAMFCVSATAKREDTRMIAVILGGASSKERFSEASMLLDYGFAHYETCVLAHKGDTVAQALEVTASPVASVPVLLGEDLTLTVEKGKGSQLRVEYDLPERVAAPIEAEQLLGVAKVYLGEDLLREAPLTAGAFAPKSGFWDRYRALWQAWVPQTCKTEANPLY